ncbi:MAG: hypothetical protein COU33_04415 [Candidatus Magasanikbacteria bacterium CG10_big_fil_rev_8_21_14_0_10_43_6]|uniref:Uncharacterized protein n=1 Tax=Candidatus Magasanikbacteria bacterium CG10_big_fil_rev_8_21_14_0_10_43_6 TaxID=1974650 RepID=A0A2M6W067_9BACT|nr:MAG: hypothetical protein COU33_04415 [Candidatus Magasanikbacteria bacterium CG10_big_fil_rev_8_21_14_0_10_43_6]
MKKRFQQWYENVVDLLPFSILAIGTVLLPLFFLPFTRDSVNLSKELFLFIITAIALLSWFLRISRSKKIRIRRTILDIPLLLFLVFIGMSFLFSTSATASFFGFTHQFVLHILAILPAVIWTWLLIQEVRTPQRWHVCLMAFLLGGIGALVMFLFGSSALLHGVFTPLHLSFVGFNTVSTLNSVFGVYMVLLALVALGLILKKESSLWAYIIPTVTLVLSVWGMFRIGFVVLWVLFATGLLLLLLFGWFAVERIRTSVLSLVLFLCIASVLLAVLGSPASLKLQLPAEVTLGIATSWDITKQTLLSGVTSFLFGSGPGTFVYDFSAFRPALFNTSELVSGVRFYVPFNTFFSFAAEFGLLGVVSFLVLVLIILGAILTSWKELSVTRFQQIARLMSHTRLVSLDGFIISIAWVISTIGMGIAFYDMTLWWLWWWLLGMSIVGLSSGASTLIHEKTYALKLSAQYALLVSFGIVVVTTVMIIFGAFGVRFYAAEVWFTKAQQADIRTSQQYIEQAVSQRPQYAPYHTALARVHLQYARIETEKSVRSDDVVAERLALAVNQAKIAAEIAPHDVEVWDTLAFMYMNARTFAPDANGWAEEALIKAIQLEPTNATLYWRLGNVYAFQEKFDEAEKAYTNAVTLKPNYVAAYMNLGDLYEKEENIDDAIVAYQLALAEAPTQTDVLYHLGRLFFNRGEEGDIALAEQAWTIAVEQNPNYSNALYSLGLLHENKGDLSTAVSFFQKVRELNPNNNDVKQKIQQLLGR